MHDRLRDAGVQLYFNYLPELITDLSGQYSNYTTVQPCFDSLLYQIQHINETVIGLPPNLEVHVLWCLPMLALVLWECLLDDFAYCLIGLKNSSKCCWVHSW